ncbi:hypothetical protein LTR36_003906 [Oleoguttula mirabilis]|uniref:Uncharacterized protein n=1 Tax=Oleoguttula mirabilis TaxID=1507867 RepID=A0AAV9JHJ3_9PEZI|nr:hypothetical protein LTR36_003906 [Oleoguttula mirabilis]
MPATSPGQGQEDERRIPREDDHRRVSLLPTLDRQDQKVFNKGLPHQRCLLLQAELVSDPPTLKLLDAAPMTDVGASMSLTEIAIAGSAFLSVKRHYRKLIRQRHEHGMLLTHWANAMQSYQDKRRLAHESFAELATFPLQAEPGPIRTTTTYFQSIKSQLQDDQVVLAEQYRTTLDLDAKTGSLESEIASEETQFLAALTDFMRSLPGGAVLLKQLEVDSGGRVSSNAEATEDIPELADRYFHKLGEIRLKRESLGEFEDAHEETLRQRDLLRDQESEPLDSDDDFQAAYAQEYELLVKEIREGDAEAESLRQVCELQGLDLQYLRHRNRSDSSSDATPLQYPPRAFFGGDDIASAAFGALTLPPLAGSVIIRGSATGDPEEVDPSQGMYEPTGAHVEQWLHEVHDQDDHLEATKPPTTPETPRLFPAQKLSLEIYH